ncbi:MAG: GNAT family N-acetyltransferase [Bacteroidia bacterium]
MPINKVLFSSERLNLREIGIDDASWFYKLNQDSEVMQFTGDVSFNSITETEEFLKSYITCYAKTRMGRWAISLKSNNEIIGWCGLKLHKNGEVDLGFRIFKHQWGKGYATEAAKASIEFGFSQLNLRSIIANHQEDNKASKRVLEKLGFKQHRSFLENGKKWLGYSLSDLVT